MHSAALIRQSISLWKKKEIVFNCCDIITHLQLFETDNGPRMLRIWQRVISICLPRCVYNVERDGRSGDGQTVNGIASTVYRSMTAQCQQNAPCTTNQLDSFPWNYLGLCRRNEETFRLLLFKTGSSSSSRQVAIDLFSRKGNKRRTLFVVVPNEPSTHTPIHSEPRSNLYRGREHIKGTYYIRKEKRKKNNNAHRCRLLRRNKKQNNYRESARRYQTCLFHFPPLLFVRWFVHQRSFDLLSYIKEPFSLVAQSNLSVVYKKRTNGRELPL